MGLFQFQTYYLDICFLFLDADDEEDDFEEEKIDVNNSVSPSHSKENGFKEIQIRFLTEEEKQRKEAQITEKEPDKGKNLFLDIFSIILCCSKT